MSDLWFYTHAGATHGPVSAVRLRGLIETDGLAPDDLIWPTGVAPMQAVRADAALAFPRTPAVTPDAFVPAPQPVPDWLPELAEALAAVKDLTALPPPSPDAWLPDVRRAENASRSTGTRSNAPGQE